VWLPYLKVESVLFVYESCQLRMCVVSWWHGRKNLEAWIKRIHMKKAWKIVKVGDEGPEYTRSKNLMT